MAVGLACIFFAFTSKVTLDGATEIPTAQNTQTTMDKLSYSLGLLVAQNLKKQGLVEVNATDMTTGIQDVISGNTPKWSLEEASKIVNDHMSKLQEKAHAGNLEKGKNFLIENAKKEGITQLPSGLQYQVLKEGSGPSPKATDKVTTHYLSLIHI